MRTITDAMEEIRARLDARVSRQVTTDPSRTANTPCVLVELPQIEMSGTLCGEYLYRHTVLVIGLPGSRAELGPLSKLMAEVLDAIEEEGMGLSLAEPVGYVPLNDAGAADPCQAYRLTIEEYQ